MTEQKPKPAFAEKKLTINNKLGLHARPAALFVQTANRFNCDVSVEKGEEKVNGKSIMGIMTLAVEQGSVIVVRTEGPEAQAAMDELTRLIEGNFGED